MTFSRVALRSLKANTPLLFKSTMTSLQQIEWWAPGRKSADVYYSGFLKSPHCVWICVNLMTAELTGHERNTQCTKYVRAWNFFEEGNNQQPYRSLPGPGCTRAKGNQATEFERRNCNKFSQFLHFELVTAKVYTCEIRRLSTRCKPRLTVFTELDRKQESWSTNFNRCRLKKFLR